MILCQSKVALDGYYISQLQKTIYSVEELAYICIHQGYALDSDFVNTELVQWIEEQCQCEELSYRLYAVMKEPEAESRFIENILRYVGYVSESEISRIVQKLSKGLSLSGIEHKKLEADAWYQERRYVKAIEAYQELLDELPEETVELKAACFYNMAAAKAQMFWYEQALEDLEQAYRLMPTEDTLLSWLATARMLYPEKQYLDIISEREDLYQISLSLEEKIKSIEAAVIKTEEGQELEKLREWMQFGGEEGFYVASGRVLRKLCNEYREYYE